VLCCSVVLFCVVDTGCHLCSLCVWHSVMFSHVCVVLGAECVECACGACECVWVSVVGVLCGMWYCCFVLCCGHGMPFV